MAAVDEIAIKLGIQLGEFKQQVKDARAEIARLKREGETKEFFGGIKTATKNLNDFKNLIGGSVLASAVRGFFELAIDAAKKSTDATDTNAAAVREFAKGLEEAKGVAATIAVTTVGAFNKLGAAIGDAINIGRSFIENGLQGFEKWAEAQDLIEAQTRAIAEQEAKFAEVRKKHGAEFLSITKALAEEQKKRQELELQGLNVYQTRTNLLKEIAAIEAKLNAGGVEQIERRRLELKLSQTKTELLRANIAAEKESAAAQEKAAQEETRATAESIKAAQERRQELSLSADKEAEIFSLRQKSAEQAAAQGRAELEAQKKQSAEIERQMEAVKLRAKLTESLAPSEQKRLVELAEQTAELQKQIAQKEKILAASKVRDPIESKLLDTLKGQVSALKEETNGLLARAGITNNFTEAEAKFLAQLVEQKRAIFEQIELLQKRAQIPNALKEGEIELLVPLQEQARIYTLLIEKIKERTATGGAQTAEEIEYLNALKSSAETMLAQLKHLAARNIASEGLTDKEAATLAVWERESAELVEQIQLLNERRNASSGISEEEAARIVTLERELAVLTEQIGKMKERQTATGNLAAKEAEVREVFEAQQLALIDEVNVMLNRKNVTDDQRAADLARLKTITEQTAAQEKQTEATVKSGTVTAANLDATIKMTAAQKQRKEMLDLETQQHQLIVDLKRIDEKIQREGINEDLKDARQIIIDTIKDTERQIEAKKNISIGLEQDVEYYKLINKDQKTLTIQDIERLQLLKNQRKEAQAIADEQQRQVRIQELWGLLQENKITPGQIKELETLQKQSKEYATQLKAKQDMAKAIESAIVDQNQLSAAIQAGAQMMDEEARRAKILADELERAAKAKLSLSGTVTNTGDIGTLSNDALKELNISVKKQLSLLEAQTLNQRQATVEEALLKAQITAIQKELDLRRDFVQVSTLLGNGKATVQFGGDTFNRLQNLISPDAVKATANATTKTLDILSRVFPEQARNVRPSPIP